MPHLTAGDNFLEAKATSSRLPFSCCLLPFPGAADLRQRREEAVDGLPAAAAAGLDLAPAHAIVVSRRTGDRGGAC